MSETIPGPCCICGCTDYDPSMGGPTICPKCDCGHFDAATVLQQSKVLQRMQEDRTAVYEWMREPDYVENASLEWLTDWINRRPLDRAA